MSDLPQDLKQQLRTAHGGRLEELVEGFGPRLGLPEVRQLLLNPFVTANVLEALAANRRLMAERTLRAAVTGHHRTPPPVALRFMKDDLERALANRLLPADEGPQHSAIRRHIDAAFTLADRGGKSLGDRGHPLLRRLD